MKGYAKPLALLLICLAAAWLNRRWGLSEYLTDSRGLAWLQSLVRENYLKASLLYVVLTAAGCVLLALPGVTFAVIGGMLFGPFMGTLLCLAAATLGAVLAFLAGRYFLRDSVKPMLEKSPRLKRLLFDESDHSAMFLLLITRLLPLFPYNLQNFAYGVTGIGLVPYALYTFLFMIPGVALFTLGTAGLLSPEGKEVLWGSACALALAIAILSAGLYRKYMKPSAKAHR